MRVHESSLKRSSRCDAIGIYQIQADSLAASQLTAQLSRKCRLFLGYHSLRYTADRLSLLRNSQFILDQKRVDLTVQNTI